jgi:arabinogalactan endo-1,4-beta-galactosidase
MKTQLSILISLLFLFQQSTLSVENPTFVFAKGGDISWLPVMEKESKFKFYNDNGEVQDCFQILKDHGINTIRLRTWVNPSLDWVNGHCSKYETIAMAVRAKSWGMRVMINFHYSDTWADPGKQAKPAAWASHSFTQLLTDVYDYTHNFMTSLDSAGVTPEWVQVGNEIPGGMLYPEGSTDNWPQLAQLINKGYDAVKAVSPTSKVVLHIDQGNNNSRFRYWFDKAKTHGAKYDVIGMSYYPYWLVGSPDYTLSINDLGNNMLDMVSRYGKEVMVVETGGLDTKPQNTKDMLVAVINKLQAVPNNAGLGLIYWEPQASRNWGQYPLSAWGTGPTPKPTIALDAFLTVTALPENPESKLEMKHDKQSGTLIFNETLASIEIININGATVKANTNSDSISATNLPNGIYVIRARMDNRSPVDIFKYIL